MTKGDSRAERQEKGWEQDQGIGQAYQERAAQGEVREEVKPPPVVVQLDALELKGES